MLILVVTTALITFFALLLGAIPATQITSWLLPEGKSRGPIALGIAIGIGFALSSLAATWSFGLFGANSYLLILIILLLASFFLLVLKSIRTQLSMWKEFSLIDLPLLAIPIYVSFLSKPYWSDLNKLQVSAGPGPDVAQNFMTALSQKNVGSTWAQGKENFLAFSGSENLLDGLYHLYQLPSMQLQAGFDYLVYGTRWGLSIPFAQVLRINPTWVAAEQGIITSAGLASLAFIIYAVFRIFKTNRIISHLMMLISISSSGLLFQIFNGGLSQIWSLAGLGLLSMAFVTGIYLFQSGEWTKNSFKAVTLLFTFGWIGNAVTYIDSSLTLALVLALSALSVLIFLRNGPGKQLLYSITVSGLIVAIVIAPYTYVALMTLSIRLRLASGTGFEFNYWPFPSEILGVLNIWTGTPNLPREPMTALISGFLSLMIIYVLVKRSISKNKIDKAFGLLGIIIFVICAFVAIWAKNTSVGSNYSFVKVATYLSPILIMVLGYFFDTREINKDGRKSKVKKSDWPGVATMSALSMVIFASAVVTNNELIKTASYTTGANQFRILTDGPAQKELTSYNYLATYTASTSLIGTYGDFHWVSKAPNDQNLSKILDIPLRVICLGVDLTCKPPGKEILPSALNVYGYRVYETGISTRDFNALSARDRYTATFKETGQTPVQIPERFIGGNPLLKPNT